MEDVSTILLLANGSLSVLFISVVYYASINSREKDLLLFYSLSKLCSFFLFSKGILLRRETEQKYSIYIVVYEIVLSFYLFYTGKVSLFHMSNISWADSGFIGIIVLGVYSTQAQRPPREKRLLSGEIDIVHYTLSIALENILFISRFSCFFYLICDNCFLSRGIVLFYLTVSTLGGNRWIIWGSSLVSIVAFKDILLLQSISSISLFIPGVTTFFLSLGNRYLEWANTNTVNRRAVIE